MVPFAEELCTGLGPIAGRLFSSKGTSMVIWRRNLPSPSNTVGDNWKHHGEPIGEH
jgi:hypothetical protein